MRHPLLGYIHVDTELGETIKIQTVIRAYHTHYVIFIPLVTQTDVAAMVETVFGDDQEDVEVLCVGRLYYDYEELRVYIEPLCDAEHYEELTAVLACIGYVPI